MKKIYSLLAFAFVFTGLGAQTYTLNTNAAIYDNTRTYVSIPVSGLPAVMDTTYGLCSVTVSLHHTYDSDLDIWLIDPSNDSVNLSNNEGGGGDDFTNTVFSMSATTSIQLGTAPFTGSYLPEISLNNLNNASDPNGTWRVCVADEAPQDTGHIIQVMISFCANPPHDPANFSGPCSMSNPAGCQCPDGSQDCDLLPDMLASGDIITQQHTETPGMITLSNATPNVGWGPMEIHGSNSCWCDSVNVPCTTTMCPNGNPPTQKLVQRIYHKNGNTITYHDTLTPGTMSYHPSHGHIHVNNWAEFTLRVRDTTIASPLNWPIVAHGSKVSFCLINLGDCTNDYGFCRDSAGNVITMADVPNAPFGLVSGCGVDQGIYTGNLDIYDQNLPDMFMDLSGVCNGDYYIVSITDPDNNFIEQNDNNNWVAVPITLTMQHMPITGSFNITSVSGNSASFSSNNTDVTSFMWDFGDGSVDSTSNPTMHTYTYGGTYTVTLIQSNPCGTDTTSQVITITGLEERGDFSSQLLKATPNPAAGSTVISYNMPESGNMSLDVYDVLGNKVANLASGTQAAGWHNETLDFNALGLADGSYFVRLVTPAHTSTMRVIRTQ